VPGSGAARANEFAATNTRNPPSWIGLLRRSRGRGARPDSIRTSGTLSSRGPGAPHPPAHRPPRAKDLACVTSQLERGSVTRVPRAVCAGAGLARLACCVADPSVAAGCGVRSGSPWPLRRDDTAAGARHTAAACIRARV
ncbi:MAG: hypothetical protein AVDCRST_MAG89-2751, partial [uncultured Gemmatimonadetes bacterium]